MPRVRSSVLLLLLSCACTALIGTEDAGSNGGGHPGTGGGAGGGSSSVCGPATCSAGCCSGNACVTGGKTGGVPCSSNACDGGDIGDPCTSDSDCCGGIRPFCRHTEIQLLPGATQPTPGAPYPNGYCSSRCTSSECGPGNRCEIRGGPFGEALNLCLKTCTADGECRPGYFCYGAPTGVCAPANAAFDAGPPPTEIGRDCTQDSDCRAQTAYGHCLHGAGFGTGECVASCTMSPDDAWCSGGLIDGGNHCDGVAVTDRDAGGLYVAWRCKPGCATNADCKPGYHCATGGLGSLVCEPNCDNPGASTACDSTSCFTSWGCIGLTCSGITHSCH